MAEEGNETLLALHRLMQALKQPPEPDSELGCLTIHQVRALTFIRGRDHATMSELAAELSVAPASATALADRLVAAGWLERRHDPADRRTVHLHLPADRSAQVDQLMDRHVRRMEAALSCLDAAEKAEFHRLLEKICTDIPQAAS